MSSLTFSSGDVIFRQGDLVLTMFNIQNGSVGVYTEYGTDQEKKIAVLGKDQLLGEMGLIEVCPRSATAVALEETVLQVITEEDLSDYFTNNPEKLLQIMKQLSARIRETSQKYHSACHALSENEEAVQNGTEKSEELNRQLKELCKEAESYGSYQVCTNSSFYRFVKDDIESYHDSHHVVKANLIERLAVRRISPEEMHANPDDEFSIPSVGPNDRIIQEYIESIPRLKRANMDIFDEPVIVHKMQPDGYLILNGHHRWAAALKTGLDKIRAEIINPKI